MSADLGRKGYKVRFFNNPLEALKETHPGSPDLFFTDVVMPQLNGLMLAEQVR